MVANFCFQLVLHGEVNVPLFGDLPRELIVSWSDVLEAVCGLEDQRDSQNLYCGRLLLSGCLLPRLFALLSLFVYG